MQGAQKPAEAMQLPSQVCCIPTTRALDSTRGEKAAGLKTDRNTQHLLSVGKGQVATKKCAVQGHTIVVLWHNHPAQACTHSLHKGRGWEGSGGKQLRCWASKRMQRSTHGTCDTLNIFTAADNAAHPSTFIQRARELTLPWLGHSPEPPCQLQPSSKEKRFMH